ncbi:2793_t:CDS:2 [Paraglomus occultum]|uniref:2793_t:CDS:1 n=1 Tax=Paraglomus occultum TaxID=144539 RepID=A0A9N9AFV7_9GLOM|nr:2793_t:CDS:2 [Paraglomus occultum]
MFVLSRDKVWAKFIIITPLECWAQIRKKFNMFTNYTRLLIPTDSSIYHPASFGKAFPQQKRVHVSLARTITTTSAPQQHASFDVAKLHPVFCEYSDETRNPVQKVEKSKL